MKSRDLIKEIWDINKHGDKLEKEFADFINNYLSYYKKIWELYIGNNGTEDKAKIAEIPNFSTDENDYPKRIKFSEFHYTCLESIVCMQAIVIKSKEYSVETMDKYINILNDYIAYGAHIGRLRDNLKMLWALLLDIDMNDKRSNKNPVFDKIQDLKKYFEQRCIIVHGKKIPFSISENNKLLGIKSTILKKETFNSNWLWNDMTNTDIVDLGNYFEETFNDIVKIANDIILKEIYEKIKSSIMNDKEMEEPIERNNDNFDTPISGSISPII